MKIVAIAAAVGGCLCLTVAMSAFAGDCGNQVRANSPCKTEADTCYTSPDGTISCAGMVDDPKPGAFQCDDPADDKNCTGNGFPFAPCNVRCQCVDDTQNGGCKCKGGTIQASNAETLKTIDQDCGA